MILPSFLLAAAIGFDAGADLRIRQEVLDNVPGLPNGGVLSTKARSGRDNHIRFRPRVWGEMKLTDENIGKFRLYLRLTDEFRCYFNQKNHRDTWPGEVVVDNLLLEGKELFDGTFDFVIGRQDIYGLYGLDHIFVDGTPGDGSRTVFADMVRFGIKVSEDSRFDFFGIYNGDDNALRFGTDRSNHRSISGLGGNAELEMDDFGFGVVFGSKAGAGLPYQLFLMEKGTRSFHRGGIKHPWTRRTLLGVKTMPELTDELSLQLEAMGQCGENGNDDTLTGYSAYLGVNWRKKSGLVKPFAKLGYHLMSGDSHAAEEDGGHSAWDPMWARGVNDSELFLYGTHYGAAWWSNMHYVKATAGIDLGAHHTITLSTGPLFAEQKDGMGGGDGAFKGLLSQIRYDFPIWTLDKSKGDRFEVFGHILGDFFQPGDYYKTSEFAWFVRWQLEFRF